MPIYGAKVSALLPRLLLGVIVDFARLIELRGNLPFGRRNRFKSMSHPNTKRRENGGKNEAPGECSRSKNASVSEGNDNTRTQLVYMNHISSLPSVFRFFATLKIFSSLSKSS